MRRLGVYSFFAACIFSLSYICGVHASEEHVVPQRELQLTPSQLSQNGFLLAKSTFLPDRFDDLGLSSYDTLDGNYGSDSCAGYSLFACPSGGNCSSCPTNSSRFKLNSCKSGYKQSGNTCVLSSCSALGYEASIPQNKICTQTTQGGLTCYKDCRAISCSGYTLNCSTKPVNVESLAKCPDCTSSAANCGSDVCKVSKCSDGYKVSSNGLSCVALDDTCPTGYYKECETGTQGEPVTTEAGTQCWQCKPNSVRCEELGYNDSSYWDDNKPPSGNYEFIPSDSCPYDDSYSKGQWVEVITSIGDILYSDLSTGAPANHTASGKTAIGVVFDPDKTLAIALDASTFKWAVKNYAVPTLTNYRYESDAKNDWDGHGNTKKIVQYEAIAPTEYPAAAYANTYVTAGTSAGNWYLPSYGEVNAIYKQQEILNNTLTTLGANTLSTSWHWSSTQSDFGGWRQYYSNGNGTGSSRMDTYTVNPVINYTNLEGDAGECQSATTTYAQVGAIYYSDGTFTLDADTCKTPIGIVVSVSNGHGLIVSLAEQSNPAWGGKGFNSDCIADKSSADSALTDMNGLANTQCLEECVGLHSHTPINYCLTMARKSEVNPSAQWYLPAAGELALIRPNYTAINSSLGKLVDAGVPDVAKLSSEWYWSSTEYNNSSAWGVVVSASQYTNPMEKDVWAPARCFMAY